MEFHPQSPVIFAVVAVEKIHIILQNTAKVWVASLKYSPDFQVVADSVSPECSCHFKTGGPHCSVIFRRAYEPLSAEGFELASSSNIHAIKTLQNAIS